MPERPGVSLFIAIASLAEQYIPVLQEKLIIRRVIAGVIIFSGCNQIVGI